MSTERDEFELDAEIRAAFEALEAAVPAGYFDDFETRLQARLEQEAMTEIAEKTSNPSDTPSPEDDGVNPADHADDSDLTDIRALAAKTKLSVSQRMLAVTDDDDEPLAASISLALRTISLPDPGKSFKVFAANENSTDAPVPAREDEGGLPTWIWAAISAALAAAIVFFLVRGDKREQATEVAVNQPAPTSPTQPDPLGSNTGVAMNTDTTQPDPLAITPGTDETGSPDTLPGAIDGTGTGDDQDAADDDDQESTESADKSEQTSTSAGATRRGSNTDSKASRARSVARAKSSAEDKDTSTEPVAPVDTTPPPKPPEKKKDTLEELLSEASGGTDDKSGATGGAAGKDAPKEPARKALTRGDVKKAMTAVQGKTRACYDKYKQTGMVMIKFVVEPTGKVSDAHATRDFAGTDTGKCVANVVESATFPTFSGPQQSFSYAFLLSQ